MTVIVTGAAGFVGFHVTKALLARGEQVVGIDNLNDYYSVLLKRARLNQLLPMLGFRFASVDIADRLALFETFDRAPSTSYIIHLAAQAGVRYSMIDPYAYVMTNVLGHLTVLEAARRLPKLKHLVYASSSSVYGGNTKLPFAECDRVDTPVSLYAATKRSDELISHAYGHLYGIPQTGLRFFTVYGPWGRPDMAYFSFAEKILRGEPITLYDQGRSRRDFTYIDDIVQGVLRCLEVTPSSGTAPRVFNIGNSRSEWVFDLVRMLENGLGRQALIQDTKRPAADVAETCADLAAISAHCGYSPTTTLEEGVPRFVSWFLKYKNLQETV